MKHAAGCLLIVLLAAGCLSPQTDPPIQSVQLVRSGASWDGRPLPAYPAAAPEISILRITIPAGQTLPLHKHPVINAGVLLKGELTVTTERGDMLHLKAGDPIVEVVDTWHSGRNAGKGPAEIVVFYAGVQEAPVTLHPPEAARTDVAPDAAERTTP